MRIWIKFLDWLGSARRENEDISSDALRIASLEAANNEMARRLAAARNDLSRAIQGNAAWSAKCKDLQDKLDKLTKLYAADFPLIEYANRQKANRARYDAKRRGK